MSSPWVTGFHDPATGTITYVVADRTHRRAAVVDPVWDFEPKSGRLSTRSADRLSSFLEQEKRLHQLKLPAALEFARANRLDRALYRPQNARLGIVTVGKSYLDVRQALDDLHIDEAEAERLGVGVYKVAMVFPLEPQRLIQFCAGLDEVLVVEEKRALIETQAKEALYNLPDNRRPRLFGCEISGLVKVDPVESRLGRHFQTLGNPQLLPAGFTRDHSQLAGKKNPAAGFGSHNGIGRTLGSARRHRQSSRSGKGERRSGKKGSAVHDSGAVEAEQIGLSRQRQLSRIALEQRQAFTSRQAGGQLFFSHANWVERRPISA